MYYTTPKAGTCTYKIIYMYMYCISSKIVAIDYVLRWILYHHQFVFALLTERASRSRGRHVTCCCWRHCSSVTWRWCRRRAPTWLRHSLRATCPGCRHTTAAAAAPRRHADVTHVKASPVLQLPTDSYVVQRTCRSAIVKSFTRRVAVDASE